LVVKDGGPAGGVGSCWLPKFELQQRQVTVTTMEESAKTKSTSGIVRMLELLKVQKLSEVELLLFGKF
jgi:hypothetical protein